MVKKQKYIPLITLNGELSNKFIVFIGNYSESTLTKIAKSNEFVLRAQFNDASFLCQEDLCNSMRYYIGKLKDVTFHEKLGSMEKKTLRIKALSKFLSVWIKDAYILDVEQASILAKADMTTLIGQEYPNLQGVIGAYYAEKSNIYSSNVIKAVSQHLKPLDAEDNTPTNPVAIAISVADKLDNIVGFFIAGEKPTGSKDPFALRRSALGIIRTLINNKLFIKIDLAIEKSVQLYADCFRKKQEITNDPYGNTENTSKKRTGVIQKILKKGEKNRGEKIIIDEVKFFIQERLRSLLLSHGIRHDIVHASTKLTSEGQDILAITRKAALINKALLESPENIVGTYKRAANILNKTNLVDIKNKVKINPRLLNVKYEIDLYNEILTRKHITKEYVANLDFENAILSLRPIGKKMNIFLDHVMVNCSDIEIKLNRLKLLADCCRLFNKIVDFSEIKE